MRIMGRRVEAQISRDWNFGFVSWNYVFRSSLNMSRNIFAFDRLSKETGMPEFTAADLQEGAKQICRAMWGKYSDINGRQQSVMGDMTKVRYVKGLSTAAAQRVLSKLEHTLRRLQGTQETLRLMRFDIHALRVRYGIPIFVTFSPDESHSILMVRLSRTRRNYPVFQSKVAQGLQNFCGADAPKLIVKEGDAIFSVSAQALLDKSPDYDERKQILATDSLASVDGSRIMS